MTTRNTVSLQISVPSMETTSIEAEAGEGIKQLKHRIAVMAGLCPTTCTLSHEGEELGKDCDGRLVKDLPFQDQSILELFHSSKHKALTGLCIAGGYNENCNDDELRHKIKGDLLRHNASSEIDTRLSKLLCLAVEAGLCKGDSGDFVGTLLHFAARKGLRSCVEVLLTKTAVDVNYRMSPRQETALHVNARKDSRSHQQRASIAELLISHGAAVNAKDIHGRTPLFFALKEVAAVLLASGVDENACDDEGRTALYFEKRRSR
eukprot:TRINITY_DN1183_c0_g2_i1.p1 TRINITY_DN1183_c0_g2~~TRINITY_DN1183_c0_g2_i1.p1  ORF type:complete len:263 (+),score=60.37 TRINITY_DN1183_c0_g2_i1:333-1121(+)